jgi:hypothetical protein
MVGCGGACGKAPGQPHDPSAGATSAPAISSGPDAPASSSGALTSASAPTSSAPPARADGCWTGVDPGLAGTAGDPVKLLDELVARCARGFQPMGAVQIAPPRSTATFELPAGTCARVLVVGDGLQTIVLRQATTAAGGQDGTPPAAPALQLAMGGGIHDAVLPPRGPFCAAKATRYELATGSAKEAKFLVLRAP